MDNKKLLSELSVGEPADGYYILKEAFVKTAANGKNFLSGVVADRSGCMDLMIWDYSAPIGSNDVGSVVKVFGTVSEYKGNMQITGTRILYAAEGSYDLEKLVPVANIDRDKAIEYIKGLVAGLTDDDYRAVAQTMLDKHLDRFVKIPAAKSVHHSFVSGLLMHTAYMLRSADYLAKIYNTVIDRNLLIAGTLLHDMAKEEEFAFSQLGLVSDYSTEGQLIGHLVTGAMNVREVAKELGTPSEKAMLLEHLILSHHGTPEHGAAVVPLCAEAELLSYIDLIDSRMEIYVECLPELEAGQFSPKVNFALEHKIYRHK